MLLLKVDNMDLSEDKAMTERESSIQKNINYSHIIKIFDNLADSVWIIERSGIIRGINKTAEIKLGYDNELIGKNIDEIDITIKKGEFYKLFDKVEKQEVATYIGRNVKKDGSVIDIEANATTLEIGNELLYVSITRDITKKIDYENKLLEVQESLKKRNQLLQISEQRTKAIVDVLPDMLFIYDAKGKFIDCHTSDESRLLFPREAFIGRYLEDLMPPHVSSKAMRYIKDTLNDGELKTFEYTMYIDGDEEYFETRMVKSSENEVLAIVREITSKKREQQLINDLSYKDSLTDVYNRRYFEEKLETIDHIFPVSLIMIDVNGLKLTNDAFGHLVGDELLQCVAKTIKKVCPIESVICRIGGDEFVVILSGFAESDTKGLIESLYENMREQRVKNVLVSISMGWETRRDRSMSLRELFIKAENHMFRKKLVESQSMRHNIVKAIIRTLNEKNEREKRHSEQVSLLAKKIAIGLGYNDYLVKKVEMAGLLHDIGKIAVREEI